MSLVEDINSVIAILEKIRDQLKALDKPADKPKKVGFDFEAIYKFYPRKMGKKEGIIRAKKCIKTQENYSLLMQSVKNYAQWCEDVGQTQQYIMHFSRFMNVWEDWQVKPETDADVRRRKKEYQRAIVRHREEERARFEKQQGDIPSPEKVREYLKDISQALNINSELSDRTRGGDSEL